MEMQHVLVVDDSAEIRKSLLDAFESFAHKFKTLAAKNGKEAADIVSDQRIDLVVTDIQMPVMDGLELIEFIEARQPEMPIFVIASAVTPEIDGKISKSDFIRFFSKPLSPKVLAESVFEELVKNAGGEMHGVNIPSFLQLMEMDKRTCTLMVKVGEKSGQLSLRKGVPMDAKTGELSGEVAACEIISWDKATVQIKGGSPSDQRVIETPLMALIIEASRLKDERNNSGETQENAEASAVSMENVADSRTDDSIEKQKAKLPPGLMDILNTAEEVAEYRIFNEDDFVLSKSETVDSALKVVPSDYFNLANLLTDQLASGKLAHFYIKNRGGERYVFLKYHEARLLISIKQKFRTERLLKTLNEWNPVAQAAV